MIQQPKNKPFGMSRQAIRTWGILFILLGIVGQCIIQNKLLGIQGMTEEQLSALMEGAPEKMAMGIAAVVMRMLSACAIPIFTFMLVEGFKRTSSVKNYLLRVAGVAVLSEIPYNFAMSGKLIDLSSRNPVFGLVLAMVMMFLFRSYAGKSLKNVAIKVLVVFFASVWVQMLGIAEGLAVVILTVVLWFLWAKEGVRILVGCASMFLCGALDAMNMIYYMIAPLIFMALHFYNGERGEGNRWINYLAYPGLLTAVGLVAHFAF